MNPIPATQPDRLRQALHQVELGFPVFSVWPTKADGKCACPKSDEPGHDSPGKHPIPPKGFKAASLDPGTVTTMLSAGINPNYGMVPPPGTFQLDVDGADWSQRLDELKAKYGDLPRTKTTRTPSGGLHLFYGWPSLVEAPVGHMLFGFVTRWPDSGYVVGPGSADGRGSWVDAGIDEVAVLPKAWAMGAVTELGATNPSIRGAVTGSGGPAPFITLMSPAAGYSLPESVGEGGRYDAVRSYVASLYNRNLSKDEMWPLVRDVLGPRFAAALSEPELRSRFERAASNLAQGLGPPASSPAGKAQLQVVRDEADYIDLGDSKVTDFPGDMPAEAFVGVANEVIEALEPLTSASREGMLAVLLTAWGGIYGTSTIYHDQQHSTLFSVLIGDTGRARKGTTTNVVWRALERALDPVAKPGVIDLSLIGARFDGMASGEAVIKALSASSNVHGFMVEPEFERLLKKMKSGAEYQSTLDTTLRQVFDSGMLSNQTVTRSLRVMPGYTLGILGNVTVDSLRMNVPPEMAQSGFANRFLWVPVRERDVLVTGTEVWEVDTGLAGLLRKARDEWSGGKTHKPLTDGATALLREYSDFLGTLSGMPLAMTARFHVIACRIGLVHASLDRSSVIGREYIERGIAVTEHARRSLYWAFSDETGDEWTDSVYLAVRAAGSTGLPAAKVHRVVQKQTPRVHRAKKALVARGLISITKVPTGGRPTELWCDIATPFLRPFIRTGFSSVSQTALSTSPLVDESGPSRERAGSALGTVTEQGGMARGEESPSTDKGGINNVYSTKEEGVIRNEVLPSPTVTCHYPSAHSTAWMRRTQSESSESSWVCTICSTEAEV